MDKKSKYLYNHIKEILNESMEHLEKLSTGNGTSVYYAPISDCETFDLTTAEHIRRHVELYVKSWIIPKIQEAIHELSIEE